jgi:hypothetical protein
MGGLSTSRWCTLLKEEPSPEWMFHTSIRLGELGKTEFWGLPIYLEVHLAAFNFCEEEVSGQRCILNPEEFFK